MKQRVLAATTAMALAVLWNPAVAQWNAQQAKAREIYAHIIGFRTAAGQNQTKAMAEYLVSTLKAGGVPAADITTFVGNVMDTHRPMALDRFCLDGSQLRLEKKESWTSIDCRTLVCSGAVQCRAAMR